MNDLVVLCSDCHGLFHGHMPGKWVFKPDKNTSGERFKLPKNFVVPHQPEDVQIPNGEQITLTPDLIAACRTPQNGFTNATLRALGIYKSNMQTGWPDRLVGLVLNRDQYQKAVDGRFIFKSGPLEKYPPELGIK